MTLQPATAGGDADSLPRASPARACFVEPLERRGGAAEPITLGAAEEVALPGTSPEALLDLDDALGITWRTVHRERVKARGWLALKLSPQAI